MYQQAHTCRAQCADTVVACELTDEVADFAANVGKRDGAAAARNQQVAAVLGCSRHAQGEGTSKTQGSGHKRVAARSREG